MPPEPSVLLEVPPYPRLSPALEAACASVGVSTALCRGIEAADEQRQEAEEKQAWQIASSSHERVSTSTRIQRGLEHPATMVR
jgi:hypothetical protein